MATERTLEERLEDLRKGMSDLATLIEDSWQETHDRLSHEIRKIEQKLKEALRD